MTAAFGAGKDTIDGGYDVEGLSLYLDYMHIMCYDYHGAWDKQTGANAPLKSQDTLSVVSNVITETVRKNYLIGKYFNFTQTEFYGRLKMVF